MSCKMHFFLAFILVVLYSIFEIKGRNYSHLEKPGDINYN